MAQQIINVGASANDGTGDTLRLSQQKTNANTTELYNSKLDSVVAGTNITIDNTDPLNPIVSSASGGGTQNLNEVLVEGNLTGGENIFISSGDAILLDNGSLLKKGTIDAGYGGAKGIAQICSVGYELKWEAGRLYVMGDGGTTIREVSHNFTTTPGATDDISKGFIVGSRWSLDDGDLYLCTDNTSTAAVWELQLNLADVTTADIAASTNKNYVTDAQATVIGNTSGSNTGDQDLSGYVPTTRTVNTKPLSANVVLTTADVLDSTGNRYQTENQNTYNDATSSIQTQIDTKAPITPRLQSVTSSANVTPTSANDLVVINAQSAGLTIANPTGTMVQGQALMIRIKDNGTARSIAFGTNYRAVGITLPTTTTISKTMYLGCIWNATDTKFDVVGLNQEA